MTLLLNIFISFAFPRSKSFLLGLLNIRAYRNVMNIAFFRKPGGGKQKKQDCLTLRWRLLRCRIEKRRSG